MKRFVLSHLKVNFIYLRVYWVLVQLRILGLSVRFHACSKRGSIWRKHEFPLDLYLASLIDFSKSDESLLFFILINHPIAKLGFALNNSDLIFAERTRRQLVMSVFIRSLRWNSKLQKRTNLRRNFPIYSLALIRRVWFRFIRLCLIFVDLIICGSLYILFQRYNLASYPWC